MRGAFCLALSGASAYVVADLFSRHEGPFTCHMTPALCRPDDLPAWVMVVTWVVLFKLADRLTRRGR